MSHPGCGGPGKPAADGPRAGLGEVILDEWLEGAGLVVGQSRGFGTKRDGFSRPISARIRSGTSSGSTSSGSGSTICAWTCAKLCRLSDGKLGQIPLLLGHRSTQTTERNPST